MYRPDYHNITGVWTACVIAAAVLTASCSHSDEPADPQLNRIAFGAHIGGTIWSRAEVTDAETLKTTGFGVFASTKADYTPDFMLNQEVKWDGASWSYSPVKDWPGEKVSFFAYAPFTDTPGTTGITRLPGPNDSGSPKLTFTVADDIDAQTDLLYDYALNIGPDTNSGAVNFNFKHALSRISFKYDTPEVDQNTSITVNSITFSSTALGKSGRLDITTGVWDEITPGNTVYTLPSGDPNKEGKYLMIIPSGTEKTVQITVNYDVTTYDSKLATGSITVNNNITNTFDFAFEAGHAYCFALHLKLQSVSLSAGIADWEDSPEYDWQPDKDHSTPEPTPTE